MVTKRPPPDWQLRYPDRRLSPDDLIEAIRLFLDDAYRAEDELRRFLESMGLPAGSALACADTDLVEQIGDLPNGGRYWFHGIGCAIKIRQQPSVDIDWREDGTIELDAWKIGEWLARHGAADVDPRSIADAMVVISRAGWLRATDWWAFFEVVEARPTIGADRLP